MFKVGDLVTPDTSKFDDQTKNFRNIAGGPARIVALVGGVYVVEKVDRTGCISVVGEDNWIPEYWRHVTPGEIFKTIKKYDTNTGGDQG